MLALTEATVAATIVGLGVPLVGAFVAVYNSRANRKHRNAIESSHAMTEALSVATSANVDISQIFTSLIEPMRERVTELEEATHDLQAQLVAERARRTESEAALQDQITALVSWGRALWNQLVESGQEPVPPPPGLDWSELFPDGDTAAD